MKKTDGTPEDLCSRCRVLVIMDVEGIFQHHDYAHSDITEAVLTQNSSVLYRKLSDG